MRLHEWLGPDSEGSSTRLTTGTGVQDVLAGEV